MNLSLKRFPYSLFFRIKIFIAASSPVSPFLSSIPCTLCLPLPVRRLTRGRQRSGVAVNLLIGVCRATVLVCSFVAQGELRRQAGNACGHRIDAEWAAHFRICFRIPCEAAERASCASLYSWMKMLATHDCLHRWLLRTAPGESACWDSRRISKSIEAQVASVEGNGSDVLLYIIGGLCTYSYTAQRLIENIQQFFEKIIFEKESGPSL